MLNRVPASLPPPCKFSAPATPRATAWRSVVRASAVVQRGQWRSPLSRSHRRRWVVAALRQEKWRSPHRRLRGRDPDPAPHPNPNPYPNPNPPRTLTPTVLLPSVPPYPHDRPAVQEVALLLVLRQCGGRHRAGGAAAGAGGSFLGNTCRLAPAVDRRRILSPQTDRHANRRG